MNWRYSVDKHGKSSKGACSVCVTGCMFTNYCSKVKCDCWLCTVWNVEGNKVSKTSSTEILLNFSEILSLHKKTLFFRGRLCECKNYCISVLCSNWSLCAGFCWTRIRKYMGWCGTKRELVIPEQSEKMVATEFSSPGQPDLMSLMSSMASFLPQFSFTINTPSKVCVNCSQP